MGDFNQIPIASNSFLELINNANYVSSEEKVCSEKKHENGHDKAEDSHKNT